MAEPHFYAGIGSRETPQDVLGVMTELGMHLAYRGWTLRTGGAQGADQAFDDGASRAYLSGRRGIPKAEIYLPWPKFEGYRFPTLIRPQAEAYPIAEYFHPAWAALSRGARSFHARNVHQILGQDVTTPVLSSFVVCWTPEGSGRGGTGQALRIAKYYGLPIFDLALDVAMDSVLEWLKI